MYGFYPLMVLMYSSCYCYYPSLLTLNTGKTAAFMLPILERLLFRPTHSHTTRVLILLPTRELAIQVGCTEWLTDRPTDWQNDRPKDWHKISKTSVLYNYDITYIHTHIHTYIHTYKYYIHIIVTVPWQSSMSLKTNLLDVTPSNPMPHPLSPPPILLHVI